MGPLSLQEFLGPRGGGFPKRGDPNIGTLKSRILIIRKDAEVRYPDFRKVAGGSQVREKCRLRLLLPALHCEELLGGVVEACVKVLKQEEEEEASASVSASASSTALAVARGRAGQLLDRLIPVLARADRAQELAPVLSAQLGRGNSKQVARSFQVSGSLLDRILYFCFYKTPYKD